MNAVIVATKHDLGARAFGPNGSGPGLQIEISDLYKLDVWLEEWKIETVYTDDWPFLQAEARRQGCYLDPSCRVYPIENKELIECDKIINTLKGITEGIT